MSGFFTCSRLTRLIKEIRKCFEASRQKCMKNAFDIMTYIFNESCTFNKFAIPGKLVSFQKTSPKNFLELDIKQKSLFRMIYQII